MHLKITFPKFHFFWQRILKFINANIFIAVFLWVNLILYLWSPYLTAQWSQWIFISFALFFFSLLLSEFPSFLQKHISFNVIATFLTPCVYTLQYFLFIYFIISKKSAKPFNVKPLIASLIFIQFLIDTYVTRVFSPQEITNGKDEIGNFTLFM